MTNTAMTKDETVVIRKDFMKTRQVLLDIAFLGLFLYKLPLPGLLAVVS